MASQKPTTSSRDGTNSKTHNCVIHETSSTKTGGWNPFFLKNPVRKGLLSHLDKEEKKQSPTYKGKKTGNGLMDLRGIDGLHNQ
jgi:hypothetical protein